jgi:tRNA(fMet)-specific endonuclease VapC
VSGELLLDTNVVIALLEREPMALERFDSERAVSVSVITLGELLFGAEKSTNAATNRRRAEAFADDCTVLGCDRAIARRYGVIKNALREKGRPIPENDLWIAATALEHGLVLVTRDVHFREVDGLTLEAW